jgi:hypothetical protein
MLGRGVVSRRHLAASTTSLLAMRLRRLDNRIRWIILSRAVCARVFLYFACLSDSPNDILYHTAPGPSFRIFCYIFNNRIVYDGHPLILVLFINEDSLV